MRQILAVLLALLPLGAQAEQVLLRLTGPAGSLALTRADLDALPQQDFDTTTIWTEGVRHFSGPALADVVALVGLTGLPLRLSAANDYAVDFAAADLGPTAPIIATRIDGAAFSARQKGPLWLIYPFDAEDEYRTEAIYARAIWQLVAIEARTP